MKFCSRERKVSFPFRVSVGFELSEFELSSLVLASIVDTYTFHTFILKLPV